MKKKTLIFSIIIAIAAVILCGCVTNQETGQSEFFMTPFWRWVITDVFGFVQNYGLRVILLTVSLKLLLAPLDFFMRKKNKDNARILKRLEPDMEKLNKQYANDPRELQARKQQLQKANGYSMGASCIPMIITMFLFITLFTGFTQMSQNMNIRAFKVLDTVYTDTITKVTDAEAAAAEGAYYEFFIDNYLIKNAVKPKKPTDAEKAAAENRYKYDFTDAEAETKIQILKEFCAQREVFTAYRDGLAGYNDGGAIKESFLWITNVWQPDTWQNPVPSAADYAKLVGEDRIDAGFYDGVMAYVTYEYSGVWNGWLILVFMSVGLNFLNQFITRKQQGPAAAQAAPGAPGMGGSMKMMMWIMPIMIGVFAFMYSSAFTLYMVVNAFMTLIVNLSSTGILYLLEKNRRDDGRVVKGKLVK